MCHRTTTDARATTVRRLTHAHATVHTLNTKSNTIQNTPLTCTHSLGLSTAPQAPARHCWNLACECGRHARRLIESLDKTTSTQGRVVSWSPFVDCAVLTLPSRHPRIFLFKCELRTRGCVDLCCTVLYCRCMCAAYKCCVAVRAIGVCAGARRMHVAARRPVGGRCVPSASSVCDARDTLVP